MDNVLYLMCLEFMISDFISSLLSAKYDSRWHILQSLLQFLKILDIPLKTKCIYALPCIFALPCTNFLLVKEKDGHNINIISVQHAEVCKLTLDL